MKYCPKCKQRANEQESVCSRCGSELRTLGGAASTASVSSSSVAAETTDGSDQEQLKLTLVGLQHVTQKSARRVRWFAVIAGVLVVFLLLFLVMLRLSYVSQFATLQNVDFEPSDSNAGSVEIRYQPGSIGKVEFVRESQELVETLIEYAEPSESDLDETSFVWSGGKSKNYVVSVTYRDGWGLQTKRWRPSEGDRD